MVKAGRTGLIAFILFFRAFVAYACPMCNDIVGRGKDALAAMRFGSGIGWSILLMLAVPFSMIAVFVFTIVRRQRKNAAHPGEISNGIKN